MDRISQLPDDVIGHILSFLPTKEIVGSSILSKTWVKVWQSVPIWDFNGFLFREKMSADLFSKRGLMKWKTSILRAEPDPDPYIEAFRQRLAGQLEKDKVRVDEFIKFVNKCLISRQKSDKFRLVMVQYKDEYAAYVDDWIKQQLKVLDLCFVPNPNPKDKVIDLCWYYYLSQNIFATSCSLLTILRLEGCKIDRDSLRNIEILKLVEISLKRVAIDDDKTAQLLISLLCPNSIKTFTLLKCPGVNNLDLTSHPNLHTVQVGQTNHALIKSIQIKTSAPSWSFYCDVSSTRSPSNNFFLHPISRINLKEFNLQSSRFQDSDLHCLISTLPHLTSLGLSSCPNLKRIKISSQHLITLRLFDLFNLVELQIDAPNLLMFDFRGANPISFISSHALASTQATLQIIHYDYHLHLNNSWFSNLTTFLQNFGLNKTFLLDIPSISAGPLHINIEWMPENLTAVSNISPIILDHLELKINSKQHYGKYDEVISQSHHQFFDGLLWSCCPKILSIELDFCTYDQYHTHFTMIKCLHEMLINRGDELNCCKSSPIKCWRHFLKNFQIARMVNEKIHDIDCVIELLPITQGEWKEHSFINQEIYFNFQWLYN